METKIRKRFVHPNRDQILLLPPQLEEWVKEDHFARFLVKVLGMLDFTAFYEGYTDQSQSLLGRPPYSPELMIGLLFYSVSKGALSSRAVEELAYTDVGARYLTGNHQPDHACIARFRSRHEKAMKDLFSQIILLCHEAGLIGLQHVSLDSTPCPANVAPNSSIRIDNLKTSWAKSRARAEAVIQKMVEADKEDEKTQKRLQRQLKEANGRTSRIQEAMDFLGSIANGDPPDTPSTEMESKAKQRLRGRSQIGKKVKEARVASGLSSTDLANLLEIDARRLSDVEKGHRAPAETLCTKLAEVLNLDPILLKMPPIVEPTEAKMLAKRVNITDPDCYITFKPSKGYERAYLGQVAVDSDFQIVIDAEISDKNTDQEYLPAFAGRCKERLKKLPDVNSADTGYSATANIRHAEEIGMNYFCGLSPGVGLAAGSDPALKRMRAKIESPEGKVIYSARSGIVEPIFSRLTSQLNFHRLLNRGLATVEREWLEMLTTYNLTRWFGALGTG